MPKQCVSKKCQKKNMKNFRPTDVGIVLLRIRKKRDGGTRDSSWDHLSEIELSQSGNW